MEVSEAGTKLFVLMYSGQQGDTLHNLRYVRYMNYVAASNVVQKFFLQLNELLIFILCELTSTLWTGSIFSQPYIRRTGAGNWRKDS